MERTIGLLTFAGSTFSKDLRTSSTRLSIASLVKPELSEYQARCTIGARNRSTLDCRGARKATAIGRREDLNAARRKDMMKWRGKCLLKPSKLFRRERCWQSFVFRAEFELAY